MYSELESNVLCVELWRDQLFSGHDLRRGRHLREKRQPAEMTLTAELKTLEVAMAAVDAEKWSSARDALDAYHRDFPHGELQIEAEVLEVSVLCGLGAKEKAGC